MGPNANLQGVYLKLQRARQHRDTLAAEIADWSIADSGHRIERTVTDGGREHVFRVYGIPEVSSMWSIVVGEFAYLLRTSLDNLAWQLVLSNRGEPGTQHGFPVQRRRNDSEFSKATRGICAPAREVIRRNQPYNGQDPATVGQDPLMVLHELNRIDKHRVPLVAAVAPKEQRITMPPDGGGAVIAPVFHALSEGSDILKVTFAEPVADVEVEASLRVAVIETEHWGCLHLPETLDNVLNRVHGLLGDLAPYVGRSP